MSPPRRSPPCCSRRGCATCGFAARSRSAPAKSGWWGAPSRCASCPRAKISPPPNPGVRRARRGRRSRPCQQVALRWLTRWASPMPESSATSCARAWRAAAAPPSVAGLTFVNWQEPIGCGGVAVFPDDVIVTDDDGAVVIPQALLAEVAAIAVEQERLEDWIMQQVEAGADLPGLYPPNAENRARYEASVSNAAKAAE